MSRHDRKRFEMSTIRGYKILASAVSDTGFSRMFIPSLSVPPAAIFYALAALCPDLKEGGSRAGILLARPLSSDTAHYSSEECTFLKGFFVTLKTVFKQLDPNGAHYRDVRFLIAMGRIVLLHQAGRYFMGSGKEILDHMEQCADYIIRTRERIPPAVLSAEPGVFFAKQGLLDDMAAMLRATLIGLQPLNRLADKKLYGLPATCLIMEGIVAALPVHSPKVKENKIESGAQGIVYKVSYQPVTTAERLEQFLLGKPSGDALEGALKKNYSWRCKEAEYLKQLQGYGAIPYIASAVFHKQEGRRKLYILMEKAMKCIFSMAGAGTASRFQNPQFIMNIRKSFIFLLLFAQEMEKRGLLYKDWKLENVLIRKNGWLAVTDFGLTHPAAEAKDSGSLEYFAPEQLQYGGARASYKSDMFSLGAVFYTWLTGDYVMSACRDMEKELNRARILKQEACFWKVTAPQKYTPQDLYFPFYFPDALTKFLLRPLQKLPENRPSAAELLEDPFLLPAMKEYAKDLLKLDLQRQWTGGEIMASCVFCKAFSTDFLANVKEEGAAKLFKADFLLMKLEENEK